MKINYLEEKKTNDTANFATDTGATAKTTSPKPKYRFVMGEKKRKAEASGQKFTDTWTPPKQTEDYYPEPVSLETFNALNPDGGNSNSLYSLKKAQREGTRIRNSLKNVLSQTNTGNYSADVFDDIDDDTIEKNIPLAEESLNLNKSRTLTKDISEKYPYYRDGMAMMYAADEKGNKMAAKAAKFAAYTEVVDKLKDIGTSKMQNPNLFANTKGSFNDAISEIQKKYGIDTQTPKASETIKSEDKAQDMYSSVLQNLLMDVNTEGKPVNAVLTKDMLANGALEVQKLSNKATFNYDDINEIIARVEKLSGSLKIEEKEFLQEVLKNPRLPIHMRKSIERVLNKLEGKIIEEPSQSEPKENDNKSILSQIGDSIKANSEVKDQIANGIIDDFVGSWLPSKTLSVVDSLSRYINSVVDNSKIARKIANYIFNGDEEYSSSNPSENYNHNKTIDLKKTGALSNGYINYQSRLGDYKFGIKNIDYGGCGIIAMYNVLKGLGKQKEFSDLIYENEESALLKGGWGISPDGISKYLKNAGFEVSNEYLDVNQYSDYSGYDAVIHLYFRNDGTAHYVAGISNGDGTFCFYNSDANTTKPMTWEEYFKQANENTDMVYSCTYNIKRK